MHSDTACGISDAPQRSVPGGGGDPVRLETHHYEGEAATNVGPTPPNQIGGGGECSNPGLRFPRGRLRQGSSASSHKEGSGNTGGMGSERGRGRGRGEVCFKAIFGVGDGAQPCQEAGLQQSLGA